MIKLRPRRPHDPVSRFLNPQTKIDVVVARRKSLIKPSYFLEHIFTDHHARPTHRRIVARAKSRPENFLRVSRKFAKRPPGHSFQPKNDSSVLNLIFSIQQFRSYHADLFLLAKSQHR